MVTRVTPRFRKPPSSDRTKNIPWCIFQFHGPCYTAIPWYTSYFQPNINIWILLDGGDLSANSWDLNNQKTPWKSRRCAWRAWPQGLEATEEEWEHRESMRAKVGTNLSGSWSCFFYLGEYLVGGLVAINFIFPNIGNVIIPTDFHIFQRGGPTTNQISWDNILHWIIMG